MPCADQPVLETESEMADEILLKHVPEDFVVRESMAVRLVPKAAAIYRYVLVRKRGYTTMEACRLVADRLGVTSRDIGYGGLKDEDGITEQLFAIPVGLMPDGELERPWRLAESAAGWIDLLHYGFGAEPIRIGRLEGNGFNLTIRNIREESATRMASRRKIPSFFLNYYDIQRFGVPGGPKRTHLVGAAIAAGEWSSALSELAGLKAPESPAARDWVGSPQEFFRKMDPRTVSFYLAAMSSFKWNATLRGAVVNTCGPENCVEMRVEGLDYTYVRSVEAVAQLVGHASALPYDRYEFVDGRAEVKTSSRSTGIQTEAHIGSAEPDPAFPGRFTVNMRFFLPSGCYATAFIRQFAVYA
jgi:tRNA pseudouridine13 synthase